MAKRSTELVAARGGGAMMHSEPREKITVVMLERHAGYLDVISVLIRMRHHKVVSRAEIIRAFVEFMQRSGIDFTQFATVHEMVEFLTEYFRRNPRRGHLPLLLESSLFRAERADQQQRKDRNVIEVVANT